MGKKVAILALGFGLYLIFSAVWWAFSPEASSEEASTMLAGMMIGVLAGALIVAACLELIKLKKELT
ncbi:hypothetical protein ES703_36966 [subsurface metagenome]